ncbi:hypothetical protein RDABS01_036220 [Bienertia sinuspersici]
MMPRLC